LNNAEISLVVPYDPPQCRCADITIVLPTANGVIVVLKFPGTSSYVPSPENTLVAAVLLNPEVDCRIVPDENAPGNKPVDEPVIVTGIIV
jgi:hypothetical protein